jgi:response regulator RpfG family c-di-GMP phosphodiesterase
LEYIVANIDPKAWINFDKARLLLLDDHREGASILSQIIRAFGVVNFIPCTTIDEARQAVMEHELHLILINANLKESGVYEFVNWLRRYDEPPNCYSPVILIAGHTQRSHVERARDSGANIIMAKPVSPTSVLERVIWASREKRPYVKCATYAGPDRRFQDLGPPEGMPGRRFDDPAAAEAEPEANSRSAMGG